VTDGKDIHDKDDGMPRKHHSGEKVTLQQIYDDPVLWMGVPHELHEPLLKLMDTRSTSFSQKLKDMHIHCLMCEGKGYIGVVTKDGDIKLITGYIGEADGERDFIVKDPEDLGISISEVRKSVIVPEDCATCTERDTCMHPHKDDTPFLEAS
jgi:hypothetical protein